MNIEKKNNIITAIEEYDLLNLNNNNDIRVFLAGGICQCENWQHTVITYITNKLKEQDDNRVNLILFNPRRDDFPMNDPNESQKQIEWEFKWLNEMNIFSMYFDASSSVQPICFYELGRYLILMMQKYPKDYQNRIIISYKIGFMRCKDVEIQTNLGTNGNIKVNKCESPIDHAKLIYSSYNNLLLEND